MEHLVEELLHKVQLSLRMMRNLGRYRLGHLSVLLKQHHWQGLMYSQATVTLIANEESSALRDQVD